MLVRFAYLGVTNAFALRRLLPGGDRDKDIEILSLRWSWARKHGELRAWKVASWYSLRVGYVGTLIDRSIMAVAVAGVSMPICSSAPIPFRR